MWSTDSFRESIFVPEINKLSWAKIRAGGESCHRKGWWADRSKSCEIQDLQGQDSDVSGKPYGQDAGRGHDNHQHRAVAGKSPAGGAHHQDGDSTTRATAKLVMQEPARVGCRPSERHTTPTGWRGEGRCPAVPQRPQAKQHAPRPPPRARARYTCSLARACCARTKRSIVAGAAGPARGRATHSSDRPAARACVRRREHTIIRAARNTNPVQQPPLSVFQPRTHPPARRQISLLARVTHRPYRTREASVTERGRISLESLPHWR